MPSSCGEVAAQVEVEAPCSGVLKRSSALPSSSIQPAAIISSRERWRWSGVMIPPGWAANARTPAAWPSASSWTANSELAVFAWP